MLLTILPFCYCRQIQVLDVWFFVTGYAQILLAARNEMYTTSARFVCYQRGSDEVRVQNEFGLSSNCQYCCAQWERLPQIALEGWVQKRKEVPCCSFFSSNVMGSSIYLHHQQLKEAKCFSLLQQSLYLNYYVVAIELHQ